METPKEEKKDRVVAFERSAPYEGERQESNTTSKGENDKDPGRIRTKVENSFAVSQFGPKSNDGYILSKSEKIKERLQQSIREEVKEKIANILHEVEQLSDVEKLLLYLQLPTGVPVDDVLKQKSHNNPLGKKADIEVSQTCTWIQTHLMEDPNVSLPKQEVYEEYKSFCNANNLEPLCAADFGKVMKQVFPSVKPRRLGTRGNSRYCYSGLSKNLVVKSHTLPNLCSNKETCDIKYKDSSDDDVHNAACQLVLEWAEKLLEEKFTAIKDLAWYLVDNLCVDSRSVAAFTLLFFNNVDHQKKGNQAANLLKQVCGNRKRETQIHLQRKLQEKELIKEQKKKVQEQRQITKSVVHKTSSRKSQRTIGKKTAASGQQSINEKQISNNVELCDNSVIEEKDLPLEVDQKINFNSTEKTDSKEGKLHSLNTSMKFSKQHLDITSNIEQTCDDNEIKQKLDKVPIPRKGARTSTVCITPGIIAVPPVQITLLGPQTSPKSQKFEKKYKRIQPKSTTNKFISKNSTLLPLQTKRSTRRQINDINSNNSQRDNKLSNLWNPTDDINSEKSSEESNGTKIISSSSNNSTLSIVNEKSFEVESVLPVTYSDLDNNTINLNGHLTFENSNEQIKNVNLHSKENSENANFSLNKLCDNFVTSDVSNISEMMSTMKRHCEEYDSDAIVSKKPLLDNILSVKNANAYLPTWESKENPTKIEDGNKLLPETLIQAVCSTANDEKQANCNQEEVSIHQLETDALIEYYDISGESNQLLFEKTDLCNKDISQQVIQNSNSQKQQACNTAAQLSQLRMLLERNLPKHLTKNNTVRNFKKNEQIEMPEQSSVSSFLSLHNGNFDVNNQQNEKQQDEFNQIILKDSENITEISNNFEGKLTTVCWTDANDQNITLQKETILPQSETHQNEDLSERQIISHIQNSLLSGESSDDVNIIGTNITQPALIINSNDDNGLNNAVCISESDVQQLQTVCNPKQTSTHTQIPSVPPSPNARRLAFNFLPISPRQTPIMENNSNGNRALASPIPSTSQFISTNIVHNNMVSVAVGSSRPTSAASSPFVSPRSTPIPLSRSRHNSGQSAYSTPRQTPLQNFDSGVSSISTSPFISPQPTPLPISRLRHNSSHSQGRTVTFNAVGSPHTYNQTLFTGSRSRHNSGPGIPHQLGSTMSPRSAPLSPMVNDCYNQNQFSFPCVGDTPTLRSRHNSASSAAPLSPVSEQVSPPANNAEPHINNDRFLSSDSSSQYSTNTNKNQELESQIDTCTNEENNGKVQYQQLKSLLNSKILFSQTNNNNNSKHQHQPNILVQPEFKQWINNRQRHTSGPLLFQETSRISDQSSQEIQLLLRNSTCTTPSSSNRSQSVPPYQMLQNLINQYSPVANIDSNTISKSHPTTPIIRNSFTFPSNKLNNSALSVIDSGGFVSSSLTPEEIFSSQVTDQDEILVNGNQSWDNLNREISGARRNISDILEQPQEDLDMTLADLRDFDTDFSLQDFKLAQELEEMNPSESDLS